MATTRVMPDYPAPPGNKNEVLVDITGPASYTSVSTGTPPSGGQTLNAQDIGFTTIEWASVSSLSDDGQYFAIPLFISLPAVPLTSIRLMWIVASGGAEASGDLSSRNVRMLI